MQKEKSKLLALSRNSPEYPQQKKFVEFLSALPWKSQNHHSTSEEVKKTLDASHYGLNKIKEEIFDFITAYNRSEGSYNKVLCLVGAPGIGKSSIARSIAKALKREFAKISLAGASESSFLLGSSKVYINSLPGAIINQLSKLKFNDPVILLDEVDKTLNRLSHSGGTGIEFALLDILDAENNVSFKDYFLDEIYPLNNIFFILTANSVEDIPRPLINRLSIINLEPYSINEKLQISKGWLTSEIMTKLKLSPQDAPKMSDQLVTEIIQNFT